MEKWKKLRKIIYDSPFCGLFKLFYGGFNVALYWLLSLKWRLIGAKMPSKEARREVEREVTFIFKSFERQSMAKRLYRNIRRYYGNARVIIADDSKKPLRIKGRNLEIVNLDFNVGISCGLNAAIERVETPFTMRLDDDMLLTPFSKLERQLALLKSREDVDLCAIQACSAPRLLPPEEVASEYLCFDMSEAEKPLKIPHKTKIDEYHYVLGKTPNSFLIRTEKYKSLGYDDNIRMIDHHEFFLRAAGVIVAVSDVTAFVYHYHNKFDKHYDVYRRDFLADRLYIQKKHNL
ncbi:MAG: glycosyltransferase [Clostridia bacterium]|nr:glycosyltransferase [Clostridia bacterium]